MTDTYSVNSIAPTSPWFMIPKPRPLAQLKLFCFPYAGAGPVVYRNWPLSLPAQVELVALRYPGRESRLREKSFTSLRPMLDNIFTEITPYLDRPFAFFGHSLGGLIAFELTRMLRSKQAPIPKHLFISSRRAAHLPDRYPPLHTLNDDDFTQMVQQRYSGIPDIIMNDPDLLELFLPILKADFSVLETYQYTPDQPLDMPVSTFVGQHDPGTSLQDIMAWQDQTLRQISVQTFPGGHFYLQNQQDNLLQAISKDLIHYL